MKYFLPIWLITILGLLFLTACSNETAVSTNSLQTITSPPLPTEVTQVLATAVPSPQPSPISEPVAQAMPPTITPLPSATASTTPPPTNTPTPTQTATPTGPCGERSPTDDLLTIVTQTYGLSRDFVPANLVLLTDYLPVGVTLGYPTQLREVALIPLQEMVAAMQAAGLQPRIYSGYRSYSAQALSWDKWNREEPERAALLSARPGHSEHQLGTTIDFGSPELAEITGIADIRFHTYFYRTSEGRWLAENAYRYGFTLSYPRDTLEITGFFYEPWHYRYVGIEMATFLHESERYLTEYQLLNHPEPCIP